MNDSNGNGNGSEKSSAISKLLKTWREGGSKLPEGKARKELLDAFKGLQAAKDTAQASLDKANEAMASHCIRMVLSFGDKRLDLGGRLFYPASRGETVFYREQGKQDPEDVIKG